MTLTASQLEARKGKLTASRVAPLMAGNPEALLRLYRQMIGEEPEEDLSDVWAVQLGSATEQLQCDWYERKNNIPIIRRGEVVVSPRAYWAAATLDGWESVQGCPFEVKHVGGFEPLDIIVDRYQPQLQWQMWVTDTTRCALSVICGAREPVVDFVERDQGYVDDLVERANSFMLAVTLRAPPCALPPIEPPAPPATRVINMTGNNRWADSAISYLAFKTSAESFETAKETLRSMMPDDARVCFGHGIRATRDRRGARHVREDKS